MREARSKGVGRTQDFSFLFDAIKSICHKNVLTCHEKAPCNPGR